MHGFEVIGAHGSHVHILILLLLGQNFEAPRLVEQSRHIKCKDSIPLLVTVISKSCTVES